MSGNYKSLIWETVLTLLILTSFLSRIVFADEIETQKQQFHPPQTDAERALDRMFFGNSVMTDKLFEITEIAEKKSDRKQCPEGMNGELCEYAHPALTCGSVFHDRYVYRTTSSNENEATIDAVWAEYATSPSRSWNTYKMVKNKQTWTLDGIDCGGVYKFNISTKEVLAKFHPPVSDAEKTLARILEFDSKDPYPLYEFIFGSFSSVPNIKKYSMLFTPALLDAWRKKETIMILENCGGVDREDQICGMDFDPLSCSQDSSNVYFYRTITEDANEALVVYSWPHDMEYGSKPYKLIKDQDGWKLDGVDCGEDFRFNLN